MPASAARAKSWRCCAAWWGGRRRKSRHALHLAVTAQLIVLTEKEYAFTHDRVREAAFLPSAPDHRQPCWRMPRQTAGNELLFRAVHHVSAALDCIQPPQQQRLELMPRGVRRRTGDYSALSYIQTARALGNAGPVSDFIYRRRAVSLRSGALERTRALCDAILGSPGG